jgi:hypothetical protein
MTLTTILEVLIQDCEPNSRACWKGLNTLIVSDWHSMVTNAYNLYSFGPKFYAYVGHIQGFRAYDENSLKIPILSFSARRSAFCYTYIWFFHSKFRIGMAANCMLLGVLNNLSAKIPWNPHNSIWVSPDRILSLLNQLTSAIDLQSNTTQKTLSGH